ncbi:MAG: hypothetical protein ACLRNA_10350 [Gemmiger formicilis]|uniref:hypothetical protein n=1 Tax=Gemmiger formicilis TaxID=745368 RepID=UPI003A26C1DB
MAQSRTAENVDIVEFSEQQTLQCYIASNASDKLAPQIGNQAIIGTLLSGIIIGNMELLPRF